MADYEVTHTTSYTYSEEVTHCQNIAYLLPQTDARQQCGQTNLSISPTPVSIADHTDYFGNRFRYFAVETPHSALQVVASTRVKTLPAAFNDWNQSPGWEEVRQHILNSQAAEDIAAAEFVQPSPFITHSRDFAEFARSSFTPGRAVLEGTLDLSQRIRSDFRYEQKSTTILTPLQKVFEERRGVCQDFAHLAIAALRSLGIPARYVSGYIETYPAPGKAKLRGSDASHAWISVFAPGLGWFDFDPTNGKAITEEFVVTARGRDFGDVSPLKGILFGGGKHVLKVEVDVHRISPS